jgi:hypothetical protein
MPNDHRARRAFLSESIEAVADASSKLRSALHMSDEVVAHSALDVADRLEVMAAKLRAGANALGVEPKPLPGSRRGHTFAG